MLIPNPFYAAYAAGAVAANCEPVYLPATAATGFLPDLDALSEELLARTVAFFIASPANPQGAVADLAYLARVVALARRFGFLVFSDECYSEIYTRRAPAGMLEAAGPDFANVVEFQSLSKGSNLPGLRIGFAAGDRQFLACFLELRNVSAPAVAVPAQRGDIAAYREAGCRILPVARRLGAGRRRSGGAAAVARGGAARRAGPLSRARPSRRLQSRARLHPRRHGAGPGHDGTGAPPPRRGARLRENHGGHRPRLRRSELPLGRHARRSPSAPVRARRPHPDRVRDARGARARDLVGAGSLAQPRHECARAQHSRRAWRHCRRPADAALRPGGARLHPADRHLGLAPRHPPADAARARAPAVLAAGRAAHRRLRRRAGAQQRLDAARWARRRDRRLDAAAADGAFRRNARGAGAHRGRGRVRRRNAAVLRGRRRLWMARRRRRCGRSARRG